MTMTYLLDENMASRSAVRPYEEPRTYELTTLDALVDLCGLYNVTHGIAQAGDDTDGQPMIFGALAQLEKVKRVLKVRFDTSARFERDDQGYYLVLPHHRVDLDTGAMDYSVE